ncbi:MAG: dipeptide epimerase [Paracoccaceae bacterium]|nr:dipeptide epimerase [Paracoccaceae bacterium]
MIISVTADTFKLAKVFTISRGSRSQAEVLTVRLERDGVTGWGECVPYARYGETLESVTKQINNLPSSFDRLELLDMLSPGAARNAVDCALWDLEAKIKNKRVWDLIGINNLSPQITAYTLSLESPENMYDQALENSFRPLLKTKLGGGEQDIARIEQVRLGAPNSRIIVDANEGWSPELYNELAPVLVRLGVEMVEQPFPADDDDALLEIERVLPVCADESCHDSTSLKNLKGKYDIINIKLDKTGGLTEALNLKSRALSDGYKIMVGCMVGSSLAMAPATLLAQGIEFVDLDGPLLLSQDRNYPLKYDLNGVYPPEKELWG